MHSTSSQNPATGPQSTPSCCGVVCPLFSCTHIYDSVYTSPLLGISSSIKLYSFFKTYGKCQLLLKVFPYSSSKKLNSCSTLLLILFSTQHLLPYAIISAYASTLPSIIQFLGICSMSLLSLQLSQISTSVEGMSEYTTQLQYYSMAQNVQKLQKLKSY